MLTRRSFAAAVGCGVLVSDLAAEVSAQTTTEQKMGNIAVQLTIGDYAKWRPVFDKYRPVRDKAGVTSERVFRNAEDPNQVLVWWETPDTNKIMQVLQSDEVKGYMKEAGVTGPPKIYIVPQG